MNQEGVNNTNDKLQLIACTITRSRCKIFDHVMVLIRYFLKDTNVYVPYAYNYCKVKHSVTNHDKQF